MIFVHKRYALGTLPTQECFEDLPTVEHPLLILGGGDIGTVGTGTGDSGCVSGCGETERAGGSVGAVGACFAGSADGSDGGSGVVGAGGAVGAGA